MAAPASEVIPVVDLRLLSQVEINSLSLSCPNAFDLRRCDDVVVPKIDRSVFNESAGSRKQTYSRLRLGPHKPDPAAPSTVASRRPRGLFSPSPSSSSAAVPIDSSLPQASNANDDDPGRRENLQIVFYLRQLFAREENASQTLNISYSTPAQAIPNQTNGNGLQEPGRAELALVVVEDGDREVLNRNGQTVDLIALGQKVDPFSEELRRRTVGLTTEEQLLSFMSGLDGQWASRRRRRRIVDASGFGDHLPRGWKLLLGLKRKDGDVWVYCRRYISPCGKHFVSCKEVSSYILALLGDPNALLLAPIENNASTPRIEKLNTDYAAGPSVQDNYANDVPSCSTVVSFSPSPADCEKQIVLYNSENQQQLSSQQRSAKRRKLGKLIDECVMVKDGNFECQFCHKMFTERDCYNGHVGVHARCQGPTSEALPDEVGSRELCNPAPLAAVPYELSLAEIKEENSTLKSVAELHLASTSLQHSRANHETDHDWMGTLTTKIPFRSKIVDVPVNHRSVDHCNPKETAHASNITDEQFSSCTSSVDAVVLPVVNVTHVKIAQETSTTSADDQVDNCFHKPKETTEASNVKNIKVSDAKKGEATEFKNVDTRNSKNIEPNSVQFDYHGTNGYNSEIVRNTAKDVHCSPCLDMTSIAPLDMTNTPCGMGTEVEEIFPKSMSIECTISDCNVTGYEPDEIVETNNSLSIHANDSIKSISTAFINMDNVVLENSNELDGSSCAAISEIENNDIEQKLDPENHLINLSGNNSSYVIGIGVDDTFTSNMEENVLVEMDKSSRKIDLASSGSFCSEDIVSESILSMQLNANCINLPYVGGHTSGAERNRDCMFDIDMNESVLGKMNVPGVELHRCFNGSSDGDEGVVTCDAAQGTKGNSLEVDVNLGSPWLPSSDIPIVGMIPDQQYEDNAIAVSQKDKLSGFDQLTLDAVESSEYVQLNGQDSISVCEPTIGLSYVTELDNESVQLGWNISLQSNAFELTSVCVWCSREFSHVATNAEEESDTLGFICPACKAKISGHLSVLSNSSSG
ncbi:uncharacterized protein LOC103992236 isoform X1 [Musa acuminata AAA Group]|uniref:uncharacterized protein LOC103992236 isoform X1 n=1 Tax=Musa acuminata AAA Group TaxID=214697 RepID=UPI0031CE7C3A